MEAFKSHPRKPSKKEKKIKQKSANMKTEIMTGKKTKGSNI